MDSKQIRLENLKFLIKEFGEDNQRKFSEDHSLSKGHVSQMINGTRAMGDEVARRIEKKRGLTRGAMDQPLLGAPLALSEEERLLVLEYRAISSPSHKAVVRTFLRAPSDQRDLFSEEIISKIFGGSAIQDTDPRLAGWAAPKH